MYQQLDFKLEPLRQTYQDIMIMSAACVNTAFANSHLSGELHQLIIVSAMFGSPFSI